MDGILDLIGAGASVAGGGVFGMIGALGGAWFKNKAKKAEREYNLAMEEKKLAAAQAGHAQSMEANKQAMSADGLIASIMADSGLSLPAWASAAKALYRPFLTTALLAVSAYIFMQLLGALNGSGVLGDIFPRADVIELIRYTVKSLVFATATSIAWWFGDRALSPPGMK